VGGEGVQGGEGGTRGRARARDAGGRGKGVKAQACARMGGLGAEYEEGRRDKPVPMRKENSISSINRRPGLSGEMQFDCEKRSRFSLLLPAGTGLLGCVE
jgi:hypothetical protein